ncbi:MAG: endocytosis defective- protein [Trizodia sp. TS-e1964]|nr:MAG: endocytosis defective- protein [Trizodia sp. TS-e1964]
MSSHPEIVQDEIDRYWQTFASHTTNGTFLNDTQASEILRKSGLGEDKLAGVWDLADIDHDGRLDFPEFCVAMRLSFDLVNGNLLSVPKVLPDWLVPQSKSALVEANRALSGTQVPFERVEVDNDEPGLKDGFDWYMDPKEQKEYEAIYIANKDPHGDIQCMLPFSKPEHNFIEFNPKQIYSVSLTINSVNSLEPLYSSLDPRKVPDSDIKRAWNLINPSGSPKISKDATLAFVHILAKRHEGYRIPRTVPPSLRTSLERNQIDYQVDRVKTASPAQRWGSTGDEETSTGRKAKFGDTYLSRLGVGGKSSYRPTGTDFSQSRTNDDWEEVRLKKQLAELESKIESVEKATAKNSGSRRDKSKPALVKRELEQLLDFKRREIRELESGEGRTKIGTNLQRLASEIDAVKEQIEGLEAHLQRREGVLSDLKREIDNERRGR